MSHVPVESLFFDQFAGVLLGTLSDFQPDQPQKTFEISDGQQTLRVSGKQRLIEVGKEIE